MRNTSTMKTLLQHVFLGNAYDNEGLYLELQVDDLIVGF